MKTSLVGGKSSPDDRRYHTNKSLLKICYDKVADLTFARMAKSWKPRKGKMAMWKRDGVKR